MDFPLIARRAGVVAGVAVACAYAWVAIQGPQGLPALLEKHREIRTLEEQNAALAHEVEMREERIKRLQSSPSEQEMEIRKNLKLLRPGETTFILPDPPKTDQPKESEPKP
ncbi:MAG: septum formation initiator family protein [Bryobacterales bacterium]|nr:septum formation initiator family protein [Bryobacterales bacterium]MBV9396847.1 septum formation initiator family protein [Bryobacterales bacterium]